MSVEIISKGEVLTALLSGEIDHHTAAKTRQEIDTATALNMPSLLVLDFSAVSFMDSSGIGLVLGRYAKLRETGGKLHLANLPPNIYRLMKLGGMDRIATMDTPKEKEKINGK